MGWKSSRSKVKKHPDKECCLRRIAALGQLISWASYAETLQPCSALEIIGELIIEEVEFALDKRGSL